MRRSNIHGEKLERFKNEEKLLWQLCLIKLRFWSRVTPEAFMPWKFLVIDLDISGRRITFGESFGSEDDYLAFFWR